jgi:hypothetical protein
MRGEGVAAGYQPISIAVHNAHGAQINFGDLTPYLTYECMLAVEPICVAVARER